MEWVRGATLGRGTFATVNVASVRQTSSDNQQLPLLIAVKSAPFSQSSTLQHERSVLTNLDGCPHIIRCLGNDITTEPNGDHRYNLFLEYASRGSLHDLIRSDGAPLQESVARRYARSVLLGLRHVHDKGFVHCDVKLRNVLVFNDDRQQVKIADFGLAKRASTKADCGKFRGTPLYMAPESVLHGEYEPPSDVWAFGCTVAEMMTGSTVWRGTEVKSLLFEIASEEPLISEGLSEQGKDFLRKCLVKDPAERWTAEMLLSHPFVAAEAGMMYGDGCACPVDSPRSVFDFGPLFPTEFSCSSMSESDFGVEGEELSSSDTMTAASAVDRICRLAMEGRPDWSSRDWIFVRGAVESPVSALEENKNLNGSVNGLCCSTSTEQNECFSSASDDSSLGITEDESIFEKSQNLRTLFNWNFTEYLCCVVVVLGLVIFLVSLAISSQFLFRFSTTVPVRV
ncbi:Mitogen-activated protein kinase kinase kinase NPK1 [Acorus gramineus]|uniref:Mitogen-activated protein kinase kinase kinase NPK1 n=1 Tax=Acorus gramineus TaxID=55184 RepID=A0AAV9A3Y4_ACOGR|nr:Mitogen-activated protein kinase kinase kinase NPK1 [Acorus gramineus]